MYRLIALDIDGTLIGPDGRVSPANREAIARARAAGMKVVLCTGRSWQESEDVADQAGCDRVLVCQGGAALADLALRRNTRRWDMPRETGLALVERLEREDGRDPTLAEIAGELDVTVEEIVEAMESGAEVESLQKTIYQGENHDISLMDRIPEKENGQEKLLNRIFLEELLGRLPAKERQLIYMRYFQDMTQAQIAGKLGISQVQVSRMEKKILRQMRMEKV